MIRRNIHNGRNKLKKIGTNGENNKIENNFQNALKLHTCLYECSSAVCSRHTLESAQFGNKISTISEK